MNGRTFGIEIEGYHVEAGLLAQSIRDTGIPCEVQRYNHTDSNNTWKIVPDASIRGPDPFELVSRILEGEPGLAEIRTVCSVLHALGAKINQSCGLHVHHDARDLTLEDCQKLLALYVNYEEAIDTFMPASRRGNQAYYCQTTRQLGSIDETADRIMACETLESLSQLFITRQIKLNFHAFWRHGTIEFRHHGGTVVAEKIVSWVQLTSLMMDRAKSPKGIVLSPETDVDRKRTSLLGLIKAPAALKRFYLARRAQLNVQAN